MKIILIILDGLSEGAISELDDKTPLAYANTPVLDKIIKRGYIKNIEFCPTDKTPDSLNCILPMLGVHEKFIPENRAYLEALAKEIKTYEDEVYLRCNLISIKNGMLHSFNGMGLLKYQMEGAAKNIRPIHGIKIYNIGEYRNILVIKKHIVKNKLKDMPPHENMGEQISFLLENIKNINELYEFVQENKFVFNGTEYMFYPWGLSEKTALPSFYELHSKTCSCICGAEIMRGIAKAMNIHVPYLKNATGDVDTDLEEKAKAALCELKSKDVVIIHVNGTDEVSHRKDLWGKIKFIEKIDGELLYELYENAGSNVKMVVTADHRTSSLTGKHEKGYVDFMVSNL